MNIQQKKVLVTGGGSGIGLAITKELLQNGAEVIITGRNPDKLKQAESQLPGLRSVVCDVTHDEQIQSLVQKLEGEGGLDILINNAGIFEHFDYSQNDHSLSKQEREVAIDFFGPIRMVNHFLPQLKKAKQGVIVNVSSGLAFVPLANAPVYCATKAGLHSWTRSLRYQLKHSSVRVVELMPPLVNTEMVAQFEGQKMMEPKDLARDFYKGLVNDQEEITPGQSAQLKTMSRLAPGFIFKMLNKQFN